MKRWLAAATVTTYLSVLLYGVGIHALNYKPTSHPALYYIVWDMFCGWSAYESRVHVIAEGESGRFYDATSAPWRQFNPYGDLERIHYDPFFNHAGEIARLTLKRTQHEPISRIYVVEENWAKRFNLPDRLWQQRYPEPKEPYSYFHTRIVMNADGEVMRQQGPWFDYQSQMCLSDNPRLRQESRQGRTLYDFQITAPGMDMSSTASGAGEHGLASAR